MQRQLEKGQLFYSTEGCQIFATSDPEVALMEWERSEVCRVASLLHELLRRHALSTNFLEEWSESALAVKRLDRLQLTVAVRCGRHETALKWIGTAGTVLEKDEALRIPDVNPARLDMMQDTAVHAARSLRAHLAVLGGESPQLHLTFGLGPVGECLLEVINPLACDFGTEDYDTLYSQLGGNPQ